MYRVGQRDDHVPERLMVNMGKLVREKRNENGMSQHDLSLESNLEQKEISILEHGRRNSRISTLVKLCIGLGVTPNYLLDWDNTELWSEIKTGR